MIRNVKKLAEERKPSTSLPLFVTYLMVLAIYGSDIIGGSDLMINPSGSSIVVFSINFKV